MDLDKLVELDRLVANALERLKTKEEKDVVAIEKWHIEERKSEAFQNGLIIVGEVKGEPWQTGVIAEADFSTGNCTELSGQVYQLGSVDPEYYVLLCQAESDFAKIAEKYLRPVDSDLL